MIELTALPDNIKPAIGYVMVEIPYLVKEKSGNFDLNLISSETTGDYAVRKGIVLSCHTTDIPRMNFMYDSPLQIKNGDEVWWIPAVTKGIANTEDDQYKLITDGKRLILTVPYKHLVMRKRDGEYRGINDFVVTVPLNDPRFDTSEYPSGFVHRIVAPAEPGTTHRKMGKRTETPVEVETGMKVVLRAPQKMYLEHEDDMELPERWSVFQSFYILGEID